MRTTWTFALLLGATLLGCGSRFEAYCEDRNDCLDGNDEDKQACIESNEGSADAIGAYGCEEEYDEVFECIEDKSDCNDGVYGLEAGDCDDEAEDLADCVDDNSDIID